MKKFEIKLLEADIAGLSQLADARLAVAWFRAPESSGNTRAPKWIRDLEKLYGPGLESMIRAVDEIQRAHQPIAVAAGEILAKWKGGVA